MPHARLLAILAVTVTAPPLAGQIVRGRVYDAASGLPIAGAVVTALGVSDTIGRRTLTNERGHYLVSAPATTRLLHVVRLGFRPTDVDVPVRRDSVAVIDVEMTRIPYALQPVTVRSAPGCPRRQDRRAALALLEQARAGLLATVVARSERPAQMKRLLIDRRMRGATDSIARHRVRIEDVPRTLASFRAAFGASDFVTHGFTTEDERGTTFYAPDADVLLDDRFSAGYCFHVASPARSRPTQVGLGFRVADRRPDRVDVDGTLWIDTLARRIVDIEYRYVGLDHHLSDLEPGGRVEFRELANGVVLIDRWMLRLAGVEPDTTSRPRDSKSGLRDPATGAAVTVVRADVGGELARASWPDGYTWQADLGTLSLTILPDGERSGAGTTVRLDDTDYEGTADSTGHLVIADLAPGPYSARIADSRLDAIGVTLATPLSFVARRGATHTLSLRVRTAEGFVADRCRRDRRPPGFNGRFTTPDPRTGATTGDAAWLIGRVVDGNRTPVGGVTWSLTVRLNGQLTELVRAAETGTDGLFVYCGLPRGATVVMQFRKQGLQSGTITRELHDPLTVISVSQESRES